MMLSKKMRSKKLPGFLLDISGTAPAFSVNGSSVVGGDADASVRTGRLLSSITAANGADMDCCSGRGCVAGGVWTL